MNEIGAGSAEVRKITTTADGGLQVALNFGSDSIKLIQKLLEVKERDEPVYVAFVEHE